MLVNFFSNKKVMLSVFFLALLVMVVGCQDVQDPSSKKQNKEEGSFSPSLLIPNTVINTLPISDIGAVDAVQFIIHDEPISMHNPPTYVDPVPLDYVVTAAATFNNNGTASSKPNLTCQGTTLSQMTSYFPERNLHEWSVNQGPIPGTSVVWSFSEGFLTVTETLALPPSFGTLNFSTSSLTSAGGTITWTNSVSGAQVGIIAQVVDQNGKSTVRPLRAVLDVGSVTITPTDLTDIGFKSTTAAVYFNLLRSNGKSQWYSSGTKQLLTVAAVEKNFIIFK